jgi:hypothetical protein
VSPVKYELVFYIPEDDILHSHGCENPRSYIYADSLRTRLWSSDYCIVSVLMDHNFHLFKSVNEMVFLLYYLLQVICILVDQRLVRLHQHLLVQQHPGVQLRVNKSQGASMEVVTAVTVATR